MKKVAFVSVLLMFTTCQLSVAAEAKTATKKHDSRSQFTAVQREKMAAKFRELCKKKYGAPSRLYKIDYYKRQYICTEPGY